MRVGSIKTVALSVQLGQEMLAEEHYNSQSIRRKSAQLSSQWRRLQDKMADRGDKLRQAGQQEQLMELLQVVNRLHPAARCFKRRIAAVHL